MFKTFLFGILLGIAAAAGALYTLPVVDQQREISYVTVAPNGGNTESFHINIPVDRVMSRSPETSHNVPTELVWPDDEILSGVGPELFKVRNERDVVIGVASRTVVREKEADVIDWVLHLPARGTMFVNMDAEPGEEGVRVGTLRSGTEEFKPLSGVLSERWVSDTSGEEGAPDGRIELHARYVGRAEPAE